MTTKEQKRRWYLDNRELSIARAKQYRLDHPEWDKEKNKASNRSIFAKTWRQRNPEKAKLLAKKQSFDRKLKKYGLTPEQYQEMLIRQEGKCAICGIVPPGGLVIDHDHATGKVRQLLCNPHNVAVGMIGEDPDIARKIIEYLAKHKSANGIDSPSVSVFVSSFPN